MPKFTSPESGATILEKLNNTIVTVGTETGADYVCDGVADDVQIQAAIDYLGTTGGMIFIRSGTYHLADSIKFRTYTSVDKICLVGESRSNTILKLADGSDKLSVILTESLSLTSISHAYNNDVLIQGLTIDYNGANQHYPEVSEGGSNSVYAILTKSFIRCRIIDCKIINAIRPETNLGIGINTFSGHKTIIENCYFENCDNPVWVTTSFQADDHYVTVKNNIMLNSNKDGIRLELGTKCLIDGNIIINSAQTGIACTPFIYDTPEIQTKTFSGITNNLIDTAGYYGILLQTSDYWKVLGNTIIDTGYNGIMVNNVNDSIISNNTIKNPARNTTSSTLQNGIFVTGSRNTISNNITKDEAETILMRRGIYLNTGDYNIISGNQIHNSRENGMTLLTATHNSVIGNTLKDCGQLTNNTYTGIFLTTTSTYNRIIGNDITSTSANKLKYGIFEATSADDYNIITGNVAIGAVTDGILKNGVNSIEEHNI